MKNNSKILYIILIANVVIIVMVLVFLFSGKRYSPDPQSNNEWVRVQKAVDSTNNSILIIQERIGVLSNKKDTTMKYYSTIEKKYSNESKKIDTANSSQHLIMLYGILASYDKRRILKANR